MSTKKLQIVNGLDFVSYNEQSLTEDQKIQVRNNIGAGEPQVQGNWQQNDSTAADYIKNRPFYSESSNINITWDGNTTGLTASSKNNYYKVSDLVFTLEQFEGMTFTDSSGSEYLIDSSSIISGNNVLSYADWGPVVATIDNAGGIPGGYSDIFPEAGVYFPASGTVVSLNGAVEDTKKLDNKFLDLSDYAKKTDLSNKMNISDPTGTGSFSLNRKSDSTVGMYSFTEGYSNEASGKFSHAEGEFTISSTDNQHVQGKYNIEDSSNTYADIIGNGTADSSRSNAATVDWSGNAWYAGDVYIRSTSGTNKDSGSKKLATEEQVTTALENQTHDASDITSGVLSVERGGTGQSTIADTTYTTARYRASTLNSSETTPDTNGVISWTYE